MKKQICAFDIEVDESTSFVGILIGNEYNQLSYSGFIKFLKNRKNTIFIGFNSNDYDGYDLCQIIGYACVKQTGRVTVPKKSIPRLKKSLESPDQYTDIDSVRLALEISKNPLMSLSHLTEIEISRLLNTLYFSYPSGNKQIRIPPEVKMGISEATYKRVKKSVVDDPSRKNNNFFFDLTDVYKSGSLKFLMSRHLGMEYVQTTNKTEKKYNITDLIGSTKLFQRKECFNHVKAILSAQEYFNITNPILNAQILVSAFLYKVLDGVDADEIIVKSINKIRRVDERFAQKLDYLVKKKANIPHEIKLKNTSLAVPLTRGGIHWGQKQYYLSREEMKEKKENDYHYYNIDFASYYPSGYIQNEMFGSRGTRIVSEMKRDRVKLKKTNTSAADGLKLILNVLYGLVGRGGKSLFLTSICQYLLIELLELLDKEYDIVEVIDMNTDGVIICTRGEMPKEDFYLHSKLDGEQKLCFDDESNYVLEVTELNDMLFYKDYNNYIHSFKCGGAWISDTNINHSANMPKFEQLVKRVLGLSEEPITKDLFRLIFKGNKLDWYDGGDDLCYAYPTSIWLDNNSQPTYHCYSYKTLRPEHISDDIDQETMDEICNFIADRFGKDKSERPPQVEIIDSILMTQGNHKLVPIKYTKLKGYTGEYAWIDELDLEELKEILTTREFNGLIMMAIESKKSKPKYFRSLDTDEIFYLDSKGLNIIE